MTPEARVLRILADEPAIRFAYLFGSRASGRARVDSDWDVAVWVDPALDARARFDLRVRLAAELGEDVDIVVLNDAPPLLAPRALQGRLLLDRDPTERVRVAVRTLGAAEDERYFASIHAAARRQRLAEGRLGRS